MNEWMNERKEWYNLSFNIVLVFLPTSIRKQHIHTHTHKHTQIMQHALALFVFAVAALIINQTIQLMYTIKMKCATNNDDNQNDLDEEINQTSATHTEKMEIDRKFSELNQEDGEKPE